MKSSFYSLLLVNHGSFLIYFFPIAEQNEDVFRRIAIVSSRACDKQGIVLRVK